MPETIQSIIPPEAMGSVMMEDIAVSLGEVTQLDTIFLENKSSFLTQRSCIKVII